ncbi:hypothetical protein BH11ARM2_BH11ARM2_30300 [soil metagenome]
MRRMSQDLIFAVRKAKGENLQSRLPKLKTSSIVLTDGTVEVEFGATVSDLLLFQLRALGADIRSAHPRYHSIAARMPVRALEAAAMLSGVRWVSSLGGFATNVGNAETQGDVSMGTDLARAAYGITGKKQFVGVISDSNDGQESSQATGDLPPYIQIPFGNDGRTDKSTGEGTAMMEIVHDVAPGASLAFNTANSSEADFASHILDLDVADCNLIVDDVSYLREPAFQDGDIANAIDTVSRDGTMCFSSAGNAGSVTNNNSGVWEGDFKDSGSVIVSPDGSIYKLHAWNNNNGGNRVVSTSPTVPEMTLQWNDPWGNTTDDYDLFLADSNGNIVTYSAGDNIADGNPIEEINGLDQTNLFALVAQKSGQNRVLRLCQYRGRLQTNTSGQIYGHAGAQSVITVAAIPVFGTPTRPFNGGDVAEPFSSQGVRKMYYEYDGTPYSPDLTYAGGRVRFKPDIAGPDGVTTTLPRFAPFFGTSAAAPHVAAFVALLKEFAPDAKNDLIRSALINGAIDIGPPGFDNDSGNGAVSILGSIKYLEELKTLGIAQTSPKITDKAIPLKLDMGRKAPPSGILVQVTATGDTTLFNIPGLFLVPAGAKAQSMTIEPRGDGVGQVSLTFTDLYSHAVLGKTTVKRLPVEKINNLGVDANEVIGGLSASVGKVKLSVPATGDYLLDLQSSNPALASVPAQPNVHKGDQFLTFLIKTTTSSDQTPVLIEARISGVDAPWTIATLTVDPPAVDSITPNQPSFYEGDTASFLLTLNAPAPAGGVTYSLKSSDPTFFNVPSTVTFTAGETSHWVSAKVMAAPFAKDITISATKYGNVYATCVVHILAPEVLSLSVSPGKVQGGGTVTGTVTLDHVAGGSGRNVSLISESGVSTPNWVTVPQGQKTVTFSISTDPTATKKTLLISARTVKLWRTTNLVITP